MADRDEILAYLERYLRVREIRDYGPQGLQVEGARQVSLIATGVSACLELFERAADVGAQMVLVHHGMFWDNDARVVRGPLRRRLALLLEREITLAGYHLCLDAHPEIGNNILAARGLGLQDIVPFGEHNGMSIGFQGTLPATTINAFVERVDTFYRSESLVFPFGPEPVRSVGIISGGAQREIRQAIDAGLDAFITGEASEFVMHVAKEAGIHYLAAGHHNTERIGIRSLGEHVAQAFGVEATFIDVPNPV
jgi:dinuclear metal center YbgI/SA1388 family protein